MFTVISIPSYSSALVGLSASTAELRVIRNERSSVEYIAHKPFLCTKKVTYVFAAADNTNAR